MKRLYDSFGNLSMESESHPSETNDKLYGLTRDPKYVSKMIYEKDGTYYCKEPCSIEFPAWYMDQDLGEYGEEILFYGIFIIVFKDKYAVSNVPTIVRSNPINIMTRKYGDVEYIKLEFGKDDPILVSKGVVQEVMTSYGFFKNFFTMNRVPWFMTPDDLNVSMTNLVKYAASGVGAVPITNELIVSVVTRSAKNPHLFYRQVGNKGEFRFVPLTDIHYSVTSTVNKIAGSYMQDGINSALIKEDNGGVATDIEKHLKV